MSTAHPWLAATTDGWMKDPEANPCNGLLEFKKPYSYSELAVSDTIVSKQCDCLDIEDGHI